MVRTWLLTLERLFGPTVTLKRTFQKLFLDQVGYGVFNYGTNISFILYKKNEGNCSIL